MEAEFIRNPFLEFLNPGVAEFDYRAAVKAYEVIMVVLINRQGLVPCEVIRKDPLGGQTGLRKEL